MSNYVKFKNSPLWAVIEKPTMLVLSRRAGESLVIGDEIVLTVLAIEGDKIKIGVTAPRTIPIMRQELWQAIKEQETIAERLATNPEPAGFEELRKLLASEAAG